MYVLVNKLIRNLNITINRKFNDFEQFIATICKFYNKKKLLKNKNRFQSSCFIFK